MTCTNSYYSGKGNFEADRKAAENALSVVPEGRKVAWANRRFMVRAVRYMARHGIEQFIDLGTGIPASPSVHEIARSITPEARVVYADNDPIVVSHNKSLLANHDDGIAGIHGDIRYTANLFDDPELEKLIDLGAPVGVLFVAVLHFIRNIEGPEGIVSAFRHRMAPGSFVAISHICSDGTAPEVRSTIEDAYSHASAPAVFRTREEIESLFDGFSIVKPGIVEVSRWHGNRHSQPAALRFLGGVAEKL
jgi:DNA-binding cell septation regulator SpoVG